MDRKATNRPSGERAGSKSSRGLVVNRFSFEPFAFTIQMSFVPSENTMRPLSDRTSIGPADEGGASTFAEAPAPGALAVEWSTVRTEAGEELPQPAKRAAATATRRPRVRRRRFRPIVALLSPSRSLYACGRTPVPIEIGGGAYLPARHEMA